MVRELRKFLLDRLILGPSNCEMAHIPRSLTAKFNALATERAQLKTRLAELETEVSAVAYALKVISPDWVPPKVLKRTYNRSTALGKGKLSASCLELLRRKQELSTPELTRLLVAHNRLTFDTPKAETSFASSVVTSLRRYERQGLVEVSGKEPHSKALRWRLRTDADGRLNVVRKVA